MYIQSNSDSNTVILCYHSSVWDIPILFKFRLQLWQILSLCHEAFLHHCNWTWYILLKQAWWMWGYLWKCAPPGTCGRHFWSSTALFPVEPFAASESFSLWKALQLIWVMSQMKPVCQDLMILIASTHFVSFTWPLVAVISVQVFSAHFNLILLKYKICLRCYFWSLLCSSWSSFKVRARTSYFEPYPSPSAVPCTLWVFSNYLTLLTITCMESLGDPCDGGSMLGKWLWQGLDWSLF